MNESVTTYLLGFDGGGTKTDCVISDLQGQPLVWVRGQPSNHEATGAKVAGQVLRAILQAALSKAKINKKDIHAAVFAMAGMDCHQDQDLIETLIVRPLGLPCPTRITNDSWGAFWAGSSNGIGLAVSEGTGSTICGRNSEGFEQQIDPQTPSINRGAITALLAEYHGIGSPCSFRDAYLEALGLNDLEDLAKSQLDRNYLNHPVLTCKQLALARKTLFDPKYYADPVLTKIMNKYATFLADILIRLGQRMDLHNKSFDLVLSGSLLTQGRHPALNDVLIRTVKAALPGARPILLEPPPVLGSIRMAQQLLDSPLTPTIRTAPGMSSWSQLKPQVISRPLNLDPPRLPRRRIAALAFGGSALLTVLSLGLPTSSGARHNLALWLIKLGETLDPWKVHQVVTPKKETSFLSSFSNPSPDPHPRSTGRTL